MVMQRFGSGKTAAMLLADAWRWPMRRSSPDDRDAGQFWRQICRWLVSEVPQRVQVAIEPVDQQAGLFRIAQLKSTTKITCFGQRPPVVQGPSRRGAW